MGENWNAYMDSMENLERKIAIGRSKRKWEDNIKIDLREIGWGIMDWVHLTQDRNQWRILVSTMMKYVEKFLSS
jgi:uncharacterized protein YebE (UPF0316 family)